MSDSSVKADWEKWYSTDPLPDIEGSLLNSHHIHQYASEYGCLVSNYQESNRKSASYEIKLYGELHYWEEEYKEKKHTTKRFTKELKNKGELVELPMNSIAFVCLKDEFRLPQYIAARFNLHIRHVHQGLLLGTGPLVDPGFKGALLVPLHNLTNNDYTLRVGDGFIWVEFTKVSRHWRWGHKVPAESSDHFKEFNDQKIGRSTDDYFKNARILDCGVVSSIGSVLGQSRQAAIGAEHSVTILRNWGILAAVAIVIGIAALTVSMLSLIYSVNQNVAATVEDCCYEGESGPHAGIPSEQAPAVEPSPIEAVSEGSPEALVEHEDAVPDADIRSQEDAENLKE